jgi:hypothetical protein
MALNRHSCGGGPARFWMLVTFVFSMTVVTRAQESKDSEVENSVTNKPAMKVDVRANVEGTFMPYRYAFVTSGLEKFTFLVPDAYRVDTSDPAKVKMASPDYSVMIIVGMDSSELPAGSKLDAEGLRARVLANYPEALIKSEQTTGANGQTAPALDFSWKTTSGLTRVSRTTFLPSTVGLIEFTLTASPEKFEASLSELNLIMLTFRSSKNGKFDYVIGSKYP